MKFNQMMPANTTAKTATTHWVVLELAGSTNKLKRRDQRMKQTEQTEVGMGDNMTKE